MNIRDLPLSIREAMQRIPEAEIDADTQIQALLAEQRTLEARHASLAKGRQTQQAMIDDARRLQQDAEARIAQIEQGRGELAMRIISGEADDAEDVRLQQDAGELRRLVEMLALGAKALQARIQAGNRAIGNAADEIESNHVALERRRQDLRVALAKARA